MSASNARALRPQEVCEQSSSSALPPPVSLTRPRGSERPPTLVTMQFDHSMSEWRAVMFDGHDDFFAIDEARGTQREAAVGWCAVPSESIRAPNGW